MANRVQKGELVRARNVLERIRKALEREQAAETKAIELVRSRFENSADEDDDGGYDPSVIASFLHTWTPPREIDGELRREAVWRLGELSKVLDNVLRTNTIRLYEMQIPPNVHGSIGDISQFEVNLDPVE